MTRPLLITDCDEVLLHMVVPFREWVDEAHGIVFTLGEFGTTAKLRHKACGSDVQPTLLHALLDEFFLSQMHRQTPIAGALAALERIATVADIVVLTNLDQWAHGLRIEQLRSHGLEWPVHWNQGGKGRPLARIVAEHAPSAAVFVDDLAQHHASVEDHAPDVWRLHMVGEPELAPHIHAAPRAHARIDRWAEAADWILARFADGPAGPQYPVLGSQEA